MEHRRPDRSALPAVDVHDSDVATVDYRAADASGSRFFLGYEPRFYFDEPEAATPWTPRAEAEGFAAWVRDADRPEVDPARGGGLLGLPGGRATGATTSVMETVARLVALAGLPRAGVADRRGRTGGLTAWPAPPAGREAPMRAISYSRVRRSRRPRAHRPSGARARSRRGAGARRVLRGQPDRLEVRSTTDPAPGREDPQPGRLGHGRGRRRGRRSGPRRRAGLDLGGGLPARRGARRRSTPSSRPGRPSYSARRLLRTRRRPRHPVPDRAPLPDRRRVAARPVGPGALAGHTVLVQGGAGAVGNAAIQLARWADATVISTVSGPEKAQLAAAAGADHVVDYRRQDVVAEVAQDRPATASTRSWRWRPR